MRRTYAITSTDVSRVRPTVIPGFLMIKHLKVNLELAVKPYDSLEIYEISLPETLCVYISVGCVVKNAPDEEDNSEEHQS